MTNLFVVLTDSFTTILKKPKLFLPKLFIAVLYSIQILFLPSLTLASINSPTIELLNQLIFWIVYLFFVIIIDTLVSAMYPFLIKDFFEKKEIFFQSALKKAFKKFFVIVPTILLIEFLFLGVIFVLSIPLTIFFISNNFFGVVILGIVILLSVFLFAVFFYMIYPVVTLEKTNIFSSIKRSISISKKNFFNVSKVTIISYAISLLSIILAFAIELFNSNEQMIGSFLALLLFIVIRFVTALFATYQYVLNPVFYLEYEKGEKL